MRISPRAVDVHCCHRSLRLRSIWRVRIEAREDAVVQRLGFVHEQKYENHIFSGLDAVYKLVLSDLDAINGLSH